MSMMVKIRLLENYVHQLRYIGNSVQYVLLLSFQTQFPMPSLALILFFGLFLLALVLSKSHSELKLPIPYQQGNSTGKSLTAPARGAHFGPRSALEEAFSRGRRDLHSEVPRDAASCSAAPDCYNCSAIPGCYWVLNRCKKLSMLV